MDMTVSQLKRNITAGLTPVVGQGEASAMCREIIRFLLGYSPAKAVIVGDRPVEPLSVQAAGDIVARVTDGAPLPCSALMRRNSSEISVTASTNLG